MFNHIILCCRNAFVPLATFMTLFNTLFWMQFIYKVEEKLHLGALEQKG
jgi:hypothetical protein